MNVSPLAITQAIASANTIDLWESNDFEFAKLVEGKTTR